MCDTPYQARLDHDSPLLPAELIGAGVESSDGELRAWCAPRVGRMEVLQLPQAEAGIERLAAWLQGKGFTVDAARDAANLLLPAPLVPTTRPD